MTFILLLLQALSKAERDLALARKDVQMLRQERAAAGQAQERLLAAEKELERLRDAETHLDKAEKVLSHPSSIFSSPVAFDNIIVFRCREYSWQGSVRQALYKACNGLAQKPIETTTCSTASVCFGGNC